MPWSVWDKLQSLVADGEIKLLHTPDSSTASQRTADATLHQLQVALVLSTDKAAAYLFIGMVDNPSQCTQPCLGYIGQCCGMPFPLIYDPLRLIKP